MTIARIRTTPSARRPSATSRPKPMPHGHFRRVQWAAAVFSLPCWTTTALAKRGIPSIFFAR